MVETLCSMVLSQTIRICPCWMLKHRPHRSPAWSSLLVEVVHLTAHSLLLHRLKLLNTLAVNELVISNLKAKVCFLQATLDMKITAHQGCIETHCQRNRTVSFFHAPKWKITSSQVLSILEGMRRRGHYFNMCTEINFTGKPVYSSFPGYSISMQVLKG